MEKYNNLNLTLSPFSGVMDISPFVWYTYASGKTNLTNT